MAFGNKVSQNLKTHRISSHSSINVKKKNTLLNHFHNVKLIKNKFSSYIHECRVQLLNNESMYQLQKDYKLFDTNGELLAWEAQKIFHTTIELYKNRIDVIFANHKFKIQKEIKIERYKRKVLSYDGLSVKFNKDDIKSKTIVFKNTTFTKVMNWLIYQDINSIDNVLKKIKTQNDIIFNEQLTNLRNSNLWGRIKQLIQSKQSRLVNKIKEPIYYTTGSYIKTPLGNHSFCYMDDTNSEYKHWYKFKIGSGKDATVINIPLAYNKKYHYDFKHYFLDKAHIVSLNDKGGLNIGLGFEDLNQYFTPIKQEDVIDKRYVCGIDVNLMDNLFTVSMDKKDFTIDYDKEYVSKVVSKLLDYNKCGYKTLAKDKKKFKLYNKLLCGIEFHFKKKISDLIKRLKLHNIQDIVLENLNLSQGGSFFLKDKNLNIKYSRLIRLLRLSSLKNWIKEQANNRKIRVHYTTPSYTSKGCSNCFNLETTKRDKREFTCYNCGRSIHADLNASRNIKYRFTLDVLRNTFHQIKNGEYVNKMIHRDKVKGTLVELYNSGKVSLNDRMNLSLSSEVLPF